MLRGGPERTVHLNKRNRGVPGEEVHHNLAGDDVGGVEAPLDA